MPPKVDYEEVYYDTCPVCGEGQDLYGLKAFKKFEADNRRKILQRARINKPLLDKIDRLLDEHGDGFYLSLRQWVAQRREELK